MQISSSRLGLVWQELIAIHIYLAEISQKKKHSCLIIVHVVYCLRLIGQWNRLTVSSVSLHPFVKDTKLCVLSRNFVVVAYPCGWSCWRKVKEIIICLVLVFHSCWGFFFFFNLLLCVKILLKYSTSLYSCTA